MRHPLILCALVLALAAGRARADDNPTKPEEKGKTKATALETTLFALGGVSAAYVREAHMKIGALGDARAKGVYKAEVAASELNVSIDLLKAVAKQLAAVEKADIKGDQKKYLKSLRDVIDLEVKSAEGLKAYWQSNGKGDAQTYTKNRDAAWEKLEVVLGLKKKEKK